jgi:ATP-binding cassette subfamily B protein AbcA/BmrA
LASCLALVEVVGTLWFPLLTKDIIDDLGKAGLAARDVLADPKVQWLCAVLLLSTAASASSRYILASVGLRVVAGLKQALFASLIKAPVTYFEDRASGDHTSRIMSDTKTVSQLVSREILHAVLAVLLLVGSAIVLFSLDVGLAAILFGVVGGAFLISLPVIVTLSKVSFGLQETTARLSARLTQVFSEIRLVKSFGSEALEQRRGSREVEQLFTLGRRVARVECALQPIITLAVTVSLIAILTYGGMRVAQGTLSPGTLTAFLIYIFAIVGPLAQLSSFFSQLSTARGASLRMAEVLRTPPEVANARVSAVGASSPPKGPPRSLAFAGIRFAYGTSAAPVLDIDGLRLEAGSKTAIIGASGSGKSTLLALIERFYEPQAGRILYGGEDIQGFDLAEWRSRIGYVAQSTAMMAGTIRENILYGIERAVAPADLERALRLSHCDEFVARLADGLDTQIGEQGVKLSGGQRQRVAIARMFLRDPEILLLDEATSHLDEESEYFVVEGLHELMRGRTSIFVTHRLSAVERMDKIVMIDSGQVVGAGDHSALLSESTHYRRAVNRDFELELLS